uniref:SEC63 domain-containing protein n=1 Tax=Paramoeba aestuarina TaxID=180227 RepID=A0A7S4PHE6_9EUKA|mmetsp:Transcript_6045/g.9173  ORF Transcript_6045/g.9173 Transcript_6045/m.9173 type:complete len:174 (+) Transcript_6045:2-523(+)
MIRYDASNHAVYSTEIGRIASQYYISVGSIINFNELTISASGKKVQFIDFEDIMCLIASAKEFEQLRIRPEEEEEIERCKKELPLALKYRESETVRSVAQVKVLLLLKFYLARVSVRAHSLISDTAYVIENAERISRALFEIEVYRQHSESSLRLLSIAKCITKRCWEGMTIL